MPSERLRPAALDYIVQAINPALIMGLVGSLVFFLLEIGYSGEFADRLRSVLGWFVFGAVLIARISVTAGIEDRAGLYGLALGGAVWLGMQRYIEYPEDTPLGNLAPVVNLGLIVLVWWCAHKITIDCTYLEEDAEAGNEGLLEAAGIEEREQEPAEPEPEPEAPGDAPPKRPEAPGLIGWIERFVRYRAERKRGRTPGVWVVYFSLAALPLFGLGQALMPAGDRERRRYAFQLLCVYAACGLGLLMTTSFLGLRRYLRQRRVEMPAALAGTWLTAGAVLVVLFLGAAALLPRPHAEYGPFAVRAAGSQQRDASNRASHGDSPGKGPGRGGADSKSQRDARPPEGKDGSPKGTDKGDGGGDKGKGDGGKDGKGKASEAKSGNGGETKDGKDGKGDTTGREKGSGEKEGQKGTDKSGDGRSEPSSSVGSSMGKALDRLAPLIKLVVFALLALAVVVILLRAGLAFLANFTGWARRLLDWLNGLFGGMRQETADEPEAAPTPRSLPFAAFSDPFADGRAARMAPRELVAYSFAALQAWAEERGHGRLAGETELEFTQRLGGEVPAIEAAARDLGLLYARAAYAPGSLPADTAAAVRRFWQRLPGAAERPLSV